MAGDRISAERAARVPNWKQQMSAVLCTADRQQKQQQQQQKLRQTNTMYK